MSKFVINKDLFGRYCKIKQGYSKEEHIYKIVSSFESNSYKDVPLLWGKEAYIHDEIIPVLNVIHCGVDETKVERVAFKDVELIQSDCVQKSVIEEKIKELKKEIERRDNEEIIDVFFDQIDVIHQIEVLQELLEKGDS